MVAMNAESPQRVAITEGRIASLRPAIRLPIFATSGNTSQAESRPHHPIRIAPMRYIFRAKKHKYCYHIATERGTVCNMQNSTCFAKLDTLSDEPPPDRRLCQICAQQAGILIHRPFPCESFMPPPAPVVKPAPVRLSSGPHDKLLARFGVLISKKDPRFREESIRVCQEQYAKMYARERPHLKWEAARSALGELKSRHRLPPLPGSAPLPRPLNRQSKRVKKQKVPKPPKILKRTKRSIAAHGLSKEQVAFIISDAFLDSYEWRKLRYEVLKRNDGRCELCGRCKQDGIVLHVDHIKSRRLHPELALVLGNLQVLCGPCNHGKGFRDETDWRKRVPSLTDEEREWLRDVEARFDNF